uniref:tax1-binding protein 1 homolog B-like n=1 Tax=Styela clava TaxID=7725 RepID=UPI001939A2CD|nr:tax1-binding protein 1 homolog B-like [Styela clava]
MATCDEMSSDVPHIPDSAVSKDISSSFSQVVFPDISDYFPPGKNVRVSYVLASSLEPSSRDWIGLFKVGWTTAREYCTFVWAPKLSNDAKDRSVTVEFTAYYLPNDENEFYQFCYVSKQGNIHGASTPFQFRNLTDGDQLVEVEDETGMIVLKTKTAALQEQVERITSQKEKLEGKINELTNEKEALLSDLAKVQDELASSKKANEDQEKHCKELEEEIDNLKESLKTLNSEIEQANVKLAKQKAELDGAAFAIAKLTKETLGMKENLEKAYTSHKEEISSLNEQIHSKDQKLVESDGLMQEMKDKLRKLELKSDDLQQKNSQSNTQAQESMDKIKKEQEEAELKAVRYKEERDLFKDQFAHSEEARRDIMQNMAKLKNEIQAKNEEIIEKNQKLLALEEKAKMLRNELKESNKLSVLQKSTAESELGNIEDKLNACEASKRLISTELTEARDCRDKLMSELHQVKQERDNVTRQLESTQRQLNEFENNFYDMKEKAEDAEQKLAESMCNITDEKLKAKQMEENLKEEISILKSHLESADMAVATAASADNDKLEISTQTLGGTNTEPKSPVSSSQKDDDLLAKDRTIEELKMQIEDLRTRLSMGATAYTEKYMECHKLEKKMKKIHGQKTPAKAAKPDSASSDSQDGLIQKNAPQTSVGSGELSGQANEAGDETGGNFMSKLEQLFMAIADPDAEEQAQASKLKVRLDKMEESMQFHRSKYRKYKQMYQELKQTHGTSSKRWTEEVTSLKQEIVTLKSNNGGLQDENQALKEQLNEFVINSRDVNVIKTRSDVPKYPSETVTETFQKHARESKYPHIGSSSYPHERNAIISHNGDSSCDSDSSDDFHLASARFGAMGLCPKNQSSDDSGRVKSVPIDMPASSSIVINRQPIRSPPLIEVISEDGGAVCAPTAPTMSNDRGKAGSARQRRNGKMRKLKKTKRDYA